MHTRATLAAAVLLAAGGASAQAPAAVPGAPLEIVARMRSDVVRGPVLDLALPSDERVLVLAPDALALYAWNTQGVVLESRQDLRGPFSAARHPGGLLLLDAGESSVWAATSSAPQAVLYELEGGRLVERGRAAALPWPGAPLGLRYRSGTDWLEGPLPRFGAGPILALEPPLDGIAVSTEGELLVASADGVERTGLLAGPALAALWPPLFVGVSADPPSASERLLVFERRGTGIVPGPSLPTLFEGAVRAVAARARPGGARLVVAVEDPAGETRLERLDLRAPGTP